ncbi:ABC transporter permease [Haladaptatus sp. AB643]|uniref:ABC transporter permease n=1 Tax=Haladaptatus sp. AB643 TaxID=2934174 RepID=UPI00209C61F4|nr:ABC transporter permease [Haladaptatus sp. AB643]MCO8245304.1 ABC transporter permease [Haladaptatus sp. AB643]
MSDGTGTGSRWNFDTQRVPLVHERLRSFIQRHKNESYAGYLLAGPYLVYMLLLFFLPILYLFVVSFYHNNPVATMVPGFTFDNYVKFFSSELYRRALFVTVEISVVSTLFTIIVSYPIAYFIVFSNWRYSKALVLLVIAPMLVGNVVRAFGWFALMGSSGIINQLLGVFGVQYTLLNTKPGVILAISSVLMPFAILILMSVLYTIDRELIEAAFNLGGNQLQTFLYVTLPLSLPGVIGATLISFVLTMGTFSTAVFIGMPQVPMIAPFIYDAATTDLNWPLASAMSFILLAVSLVLVYLYTKVADIQVGGDAV